MGNLHKGCNKRYVCKRRMCRNALCHAAILGDNERSLLFVEAAMRCVKYWIKKLAMPDYK